MGHALVLEIVILAAAVAAVYLGTLYIWPNRMAEETPVETRLSEGQSATVLFFGDSSCGPAMQTDTDLRFTSMILRQRLPEVELNAVELPGVGPRFYRDAVTYVAGLPKRPDGIVVCINLSFLSSMYTDNPRWYQPKIRYLLRNPGALERQWFDPLAAFAVVPVHAMPRERWLLQPIYNGDRPAGVLGDYDIDIDIGDVDRTDHELQWTWSLLSLMQPVHHEAPALVQLSELMTVMREAGIVPVLYVTPINYQRGVELHGDAFMTSMERQLDALFETLRPFEVTPTNLLFALDQRYFAPSDPMSAHLTWKGRRFVADRVRDAIQDHPKLAPFREDAGAGDRTRGL